MGIWSWPAMSCNACFHIMSFHFCVCLFKALFSDSRINKYVRIVQYTIVQYNTLHYAIVSRHQINTCTVLYSSVLYCIKRENLLTDKERAFQKLKSTLSSLDPFRIHEGVGQLFGLRPHFFSFTKLAESVLCIGS